MYVAIRQRNVYTYVHTHIHYAQSTDSDHPWISLRKPRIHALHNDPRIHTNMWFAQQNSWMVCADCESAVCTRMVQVRTLRITSTTCICIELTLMKMWMCENQHNSQEKATVMCKRWNYRKHSQAYVPINQFLTSVTGLFRLQG